MEKCADPFAVIHTVVANGGMGTFLKRHLAQPDKMGISANIECSFLQKFIFDEMSKYFAPGKREEFKRSITFWTPETLSWNIDLMLKQEQTAFPDFSAYWNGNSMKRHLLSCELAQCFDRYQLYRSSRTDAKQHLALWRAGKGNSSQSLLYQKLCAIAPDPDSFYVEFFNAQEPFEALAPHTGIFGIGAMSALHLACLKHLAEKCEITLFCPSPCQVYWGDTKSRQEILKEIKHNPAVLEDSVSQHQLLADLGVPGREFFNLLLDEDCFTGEEESFYVDPAPEEKGTALQIFQSDILNARMRGEENAIKTAPEDNSLRINCCPNARRELEILHDQLLELFYKRGKQLDEGKFKVSNALRPEDVIVMFPDINKAAPLIDAVFSAGPFKGKYAICDRSSAGQSQVIECFSRLLDLPKARCTSEDILELLEFDCLSSKLGIDIAALPGIEELVSRLRISWGLDSKEHTTFRQNDFPEFSWQDGIDRFLAEYARGESASAIYEKYDTGGIDGEAAEVFGIIAQFTSTLKEWREQLFMPRTPGEWGEFLYTWINTFFSGGSKEYLPELSALRLAVAKIVRGAAAADETNSVDAEVFISRLKSEYALTGGKQHFLRDKITFCSLVPLRAIPAKVIAVLGLNEGEFPKTHTPGSFDLLKEIQRNDPNSANDGRYLFLEALMAAKEHLILSYIGFDDGQEIFPAIPMGAVETLLKAGFGIKKTIVPLKSVDFAPLKELLKKSDVADSRQNQETLPPAPLPEEMSLKTLCEALSQNCEYFFKLRCGFEYEGKEKTQLMTDDPEALSKLEQSNLLRALWNMHLDGIDKKQWHIPVKKARILPVNGQQILVDAISLIEAAETALAEDGIVPADLKNETALECRCQLTVNKTHNITLSSTIVLPENWQKKQCRTLLRFSSFSPDKALTFYLEQLLLAAVCDESISGLISFVTRVKENGKEKNEIVRCSIPAYSREEAVAALTSLTEIALRTCTADKPLPLFSNASFYKAEFLKGYTPKDSSFGRFVDKDLPRHEVIERFYTQDDFSQGEFDDLAQIVYGPIADFKERKK